MSKRVSNLEAAAPGLDSAGNYALIIPHGDTKREFLLTVDNNDNLYVCDDGIIYRLDATGKPTTHFAISQPGAGQVIHPADMTVDKNGNLYIVDERAHRVVQYGTDGKFVRTFGVYGNGDGELMSPTQGSLSER